MLFHASEMHVEISARLTITSIGRCAIEPLFLRTEEPDSCRVVPWVSNHACTSKDTRGWGGYPPVPACPLVARWAPTRATAPWSDWLPVLPTFDKKEYWWLGMPAHSLPFFQFEGTSFVLTGQVNLRCVITHTYYHC